MSKFVIDPRIKHILFAIHDGQEQNLRAKRQRGIVINGDATGKIFVSLGGLPLQ